MNNLLFLGAIFFFSFLLVFMCSIVCKRLREKGHAEKLNQWAGSIEAFKVRIAPKFLSKINSSRIFKKMPKTDPYSEDIKNISSQLEQVTNKLNSKDK